tara:strand:+ start:5883 stop:8576 length:2694 start_codon:yes stop_codon:yes gene_type:complete
MDQNYIVNLKNIKLIKSTCPFYNYIFFREISLLLDNNLLRSYATSSYKDKMEDFKNIIQEMKKTIYSQMNLLYKNGEKNGNLKDEDKKIFERYIKNNDLTNKTQLRTLLYVFFKLFLKLSDEDDIKNNFFFNLLDNKENLIILPTYLESEIDGLKSYFDTIKINEKFFSDYFDNKNINDGFVNSEFIREFDNYLHGNSTIYNKYIDLLNKYDKADNIFYFPCITLSEIDKNTYEDILKKNLKDLNNKISENYQNYSSDYLKKTTIIIDTKNRTNSNINIYKNIYMFFDDKDTISTNFFKLPKKTHDNNKSIKYMNELLLKNMKESYDESDTFNRKIILDDGMTNQMNSLIDYSLINRKYKKEELIRYYNTNIKNKDIITGEEYKTSFYYLFVALDFFIRNKKIEDSVNNKNINTLSIVLNLNKDIDSNDNLNFNIKYKNTTKDDKKSKNFLNNYSMNFFNFKHGEINIYIEKSSGVFNALYTSSSDLEKYCDIILNYYNIDYINPNVKNKTKKKIKKKDTKKNMSKYEIDIISFIILHAQKPSNFLKLKFRHAKNVIKDIITKKYNFIYKNFKLKHNYNLYIKLDKKDNINVFDIYLKNIDNNSYHKLNKFSGYFSKKKNNYGYNYLIFSTSNISNNINNQISKFYYYNNLIITQKALKSYIKYNNLKEDVNEVLLKIITNKNELDNFYTYHIVTEVLKPFIINRKNYYIDQTKIINNIINILFNSNQEIYFEKSKYFDKYISDYKEGNNDDIVKETKIIDKVSTFNNSDNPNYPLFIIKDKNSTNKYILKNFIDNKIQINNNNSSTLSEEYKNYFKTIYNIRPNTTSDKGEVYRTIEDSEYDSIAVINMDIRKTKYNNNPIKCDEKKQNITNKLKKYFKSIKNNITIKKIQYIGSV